MVSSKVGVKHVEGVSGECPPGGVEGGLFSRPPCPRCGPCGVSAWIRGRGRSGSDPAALQQIWEDSPELHGGPEPGGALRVSGLYR